MWTVNVGLDYADQRFYASTYGRFNTADRKAGDPSDPVSMNRYTYVGGDPVNRMDPRGTDWVFVNGGWCSTLDSSGGCYDPGYGDPESGGGGSGCPSFDPNVILALEQSSLGPTLEAQAAAMGCTGYAPEQVAPPELCPLVGITGSYNLGLPNKVGDPVHPIFAPSLAYALDAAIAIMNAQGITPTITEGFRTYADQVNVNSGSNPKAAAGTSWHEVGLAVDIGMNSVTTAQWNEIVADMEYEGFTWGGLFTRPDYIHFQMAPANVHANGTVTSGAPPMWLVQACESEHPTGFY